MRRIAFLFCFVFFVSKAFTQVDRYKDYDDNLSMYCAFYNVYYEFKNTDVKTIDLKTIVKQIDFNYVFENGKVDEDVEIYIPNVDKTIILYSKQKAQFFYEKKYKVQ